jgi:hypothetical protein
MVRENSVKVKAFTYVWCELDHNITIGMNMGDMMGSMTMASKFCWVWFLDHDLFTNGVIIMMSAGILAM